jgi:hypothetical protein
MSVRDLPVRNDRFLATRLLLGALNRNALPFPADAVAFRKAAGALHDANEAARRAAAVAVARESALPIFAGWVDNAVGALARVLAKENENPAMAIKRCGVSRAYFRERGVADTTRFPELARRIVEEIDAHPLLWPGWDREEFQPELDMLADAASVLTGARLAWQVAENEVRIAEARLADAHEDWEDAWLALKRQAGVVPGLAAKLFKEVV